MLRTIAAGTLLLSGCAARGPAADNLLEVKLEKDSSRQRAADSTSKQFAPPAS
jgi:hypothetical protein